MNPMFRIGDRVVCISYKSKCKSVKGPTPGDLYTIKKIIDNYIGIEIDGVLGYFSDKKFVSYRDYKEGVMLRPENIGAVISKEQELYSIWYCSDSKPSRDEYKRRYITAGGCFKPISKNLAYECL